MRTFVFIPPIARHAGGVAVLLDVAEHLHRGGIEVALVPREGARAGVHELPTDVPLTPWDELQLAPGDVWLVPEGWVNALAPGLQAGALCLVYCQNWSYLFSALPEDVSWSQLPVSLLAVSAPVSWFVEQTTGRSAPILRPGIDLARFAPPADGKPDGPLRIAYMPRKNKALVQRVREIVASRSASGLGPFLAGNTPEWVEISGLPQHEVAERLASCHVFLASGFPEGCPLPPLEAMACGCLPVGFAGFGGWDYMRQIAPDLPYAARPWWPSRQPEDNQQAGNGIWVADADVLAAAMALEQCGHWRSDGVERFGVGVENALATAARYGLEQQSQRCLELWRGLAKQMKS